MSLEMVDLVPPYQIKDEFNAVQTSSIEAQTSIQEAEEYRSAQLPKAQTTYNREVSKASSAATQTLATAKAEASVFEQLALEAKESSRVVYRRLLQERLEVIGKSAGDIRFVPPPLGLGILKAIGFCWSVNNDCVSNGEKFAIDLLGAGLLGIATLWLWLAPDQSQIGYLLQAMGPSLLLSVWSGVA